MKHLPKKGIVGVVTVLGALGIGKFISEKSKNSIYIDEPVEQNPFEGKKVVFVENDNDAENADGIKGHLEAVSELEKNDYVYEKYIKRAIDIILSLSGIIILSPILAAISIAIKIDDPGPVLFVQKRVGKNKRFFKLHKFRSMKMSTPKDVPTHMLDNPDDYITRVGEFLRKHSLDELPQIWDILIGNMSIVGPRPGLWNQDVLTAERDKYGANDIRPGLTGWAQINGRDELEITEKAKYDGEYVKNESLKFDLMCFIHTISKVRKDTTVVEGGTGRKEKMGRREYIDYSDKESLIGTIGFSQPVRIERGKKKRILITGKDSYIGDSFREYAQKKYHDNFDIEIIDMKNTEWQRYDFSKFDIVYHVAGIAHSETGVIDDSKKESYYKVNTDLSIEVCKKAKKDGVHEFVFMSSMIVYGDSAPYNAKKQITKETVPKPANCYGDSKLQADVCVRNLADDDFKVIVLRPPMIYGRGSKGNYSSLSKIARKAPFFPNVENERSMLYIDNLCEFLCQIMLIEFKEKSVVLFPQNDVYTNTSVMVKKISEYSKGKASCLIEFGMPFVIMIAGKIPGRVGNLTNKAFGNLTYEKNLSKYEGIDYQKVGFEESIKYSECARGEGTKKALVIASVASMIEQFNMENIKILQELGYKVDVACNCKTGNNMSDEKLDKWIKKMLDDGINVINIPIPRNIENVKAIKESIHIVKELNANNNYAIIHCHSPIGSVIARIGSRKSRKTGTKVIYTAHGFHFYKNAPKKNWCVFFPPEWICSFITDTIVTITLDDYLFAKKHIHANEIVYMPGIGIDTKKFSPKRGSKDILAEYGVTDNDFVIMSVGELNNNKNHRTVIKAIAKLKETNIKYFIIGTGNLYKELEELIINLDVSDNVFLLGYREDVNCLLSAADLFVLPSKREGLNVSLMEAMASGLPCVCGDIRGNNDLIVNGKGGYRINPMNIDEWNIAIKKMKDEKRRELFGSFNRRFIMDFDIAKINEKMKKIYCE